MNHRQARHHQPEHAVMSRRNYIVAIVACLARLLPKRRRQIRKPIYSHDARGFGPPGNDLLDGGTQIRYGSRDRVAEPD